MSIYVYYFLPIYAFTERGTSSWHIEEVGDRFESWTGHRLSWLWFHICSPQYYTNAVMRPWNPPGSLCQVYRTLSHYNNWALNGLWNWCIVVKWSAVIQSPHILIFHTTSQNLYVRFIYVCCMLNAHQHHSIRPTRSNAKWRQCREAPYYVGSFWSDIGFLQSRQMRYGGPSTLERSKLYFNEIY
jgi:hypothetical protein